MKYKINRVNLLPHRYHIIRDNEYYGYNFIEFYEVVHDTNNKKVVRLKNPNANYGDMLFHYSELISEKEEHTKVFYEKADKIINGGE
jgi:hypothetical protein